MSLRAFHIFFILVSIAFAAWFAFWEWKSGQAVWFLPARAAAAASAAACALLVVYLFWFVRKSGGVR